MSYSTGHLDDVFSALADPTRRQVVELLARHAPLTVRELVDQFPLSRQAITKHLGILRRARLVKSTKKGRDILNELEPTGLDPLAGWTRLYSDFWDHRLSALKTAVESGATPDQEETSWQS